jgi:hypothetical protein
VEQDAAKFDMGLTGESFVRPIRAQCLHHVTNLVKIPFWEVFSSRDDVLGALTYKDALLL